MFCPQCGHQNPDGARFCENCRYCLAERVAGLSPPRQAGENSAPVSPPTRPAGNVKLTLIVALLLLLGALGAAVFIILESRQLAEPFSLDMLPRDVFEDGSFSNGIDVFIKNTASQEEIDDLGRRIEEMPEVESLEFISKDRALEILRERLAIEGQEEMLDKLVENPLPASYVLKLKDGAQINDVASRFYDDPVVDNTPGETDGVRFGEQTADNLVENILTIGFAMVQETTLTEAAGDMRKATIWQISGALLVFLMASGAALLFINAGIRMRGPGMIMSGAPKKKMKATGMRTGIALLAAGCLLNITAGVALYRSPLVESCSGFSEDVAADVMAEMPLPWPVDPGFIMTSGERIAGCEAAYNPLSYHGLSLVTLSQASLLLAIAGGALVLVWYSGALFRTRATPSGSSA